MDVAVSLAFVEQMIPMPDTTDAVERPTIGISANDEESASGYADAVSRSGGHAYVVRSEPHTSPEGELSSVSGLLVGGVEKHPPQADDGRQAVLLRAAVAADMPVLCIHDGMQALNRALGGGSARLIQDHGSHEQDGEQASSYHRIYISPGSKLAAIVGSGGIVRVNSRHDEGVRDAQKSRLLMASAYSLDDGIIEALESPDHRWVIGVQFQPERRKELPPHFERLFQSFVERGKEYTEASMGRQTASR